MAARTRTARPKTDASKLPRQARRNARAAAEAPSQPPAKQNGDAPVNGVLVRVTAEEDGTVKFIPTSIGDVRPTEIGTYLELGLKQWRKQNGFDG